MNCEPADPAATRGRCYVPAGTSCAHSNPREMRSAGPI